jgi:hypothetical protein
LLLLFLLLSFFAVSFQASKTDLAYHVNKFGLGFFGLAGCYIHGFQFFNLGALAIQGSYFFTFQW